MATREQLNHERVKALLELLKQETDIDDEWFECIQECRDLGKGNEIAQAAREGNGPPIDDD